MEAFAMILSYNNLAVINDAVNVSVIKNFGIKGSWWLHCSALEPEARRFSTHLPYKCTYLTRIQWASSVHLWHKKRPTTRVYLWQIKNTENFNLEILTRTFNLTNQKIKMLLSGAITRSSPILLWKFVFILVCELVSQRKDSASNYLIAFKETLYILIEKIIDKKRNQIRL